VQRKYFKYLKLLLSYTCCNFISRTRKIFVNRSNGLQNVLLDTKSQADFDYLRQLHLFVGTEEEKDMYLKICKFTEYCRDNGEDSKINQKCLVEWHYIDKSKSWVIFCIKYQ
jgi:hypothetical protein